jgi:acetate kinase
METLLVVNAGSSSVKFQAFAIDQGNRLQQVVRGAVDGIGSRPRLRATAADGSTLVDQTYASNVISNVPAAIGTAGRWLRDTQKLDYIAVGHRVVHGGPRFDRPVLVDDDVLAQLARYQALAPLHQPNNLAAIQAVRQRFPNVPQVACFDTAFHCGHSAVADHFAIPSQLYDEGVRRYGFHGLSYEYVARRLQEVAPHIAQGRVIVAHLGSGASMCALSNGRSVESTMGFTALDGLPMGTRPGQIDPGVLIYLMSEKGMDVETLQNFLYRECGLIGLSGLSNDVRVLLASAEPKAKFAIEYFVYRVSLHAGMLAAALGGLDAFVFTAGVGENSPEIRARVADKLAWMGVTVDQSANAAGKLLISSATSRVGLYVVPTNEEWMIANHTLKLVTADRAGSAAHRRTA